MSNEKKVRFSKVKSEAVVVSSDEEEQVVLPPIVQRYTPLSK